ncbi:MAG TPA: glucose-6-phosphate dehydrogenase [Caulobacteraceae bacterium]|jgi:glucose-6-phosphate 1-dehydrogenase|nr:glucose-6-phosphate dehydrogenase [Caulobacteraceae bacterium]
MSNSPKTPSPGQKPALTPTKPPPAPPCLMVVFGAAGDLAKRLLIPSLYNLTRDGLLDRKFKLLGVDHNDFDDQSFQAMQTAFIHGLATDKNSEFGKTRLSAPAWKRLSAELGFMKGDFEDPETYRALGDRIGQTANVLFYLATSPRFFGDVVEQLAKAGLTKEAKGWRRVVIEKPFGNDLASAKALNRRILKVLDERQIFRIDHFLGKETVQNIMVTRFANGLFEPIWNRDHIDSVQITASETVGVEDRGAFYEATGALRDMTPNHMFQLLSMVAMEPPNTFDAEAVRGEKARVVDAIKLQTPSEALENSVRGQYHAGEVEGRKVADYRAEPHVARDSRTETYVALKLEIDNWRWAGVPFYIRTGKALSARDTEIAIAFKPAPTRLFRDQPVASLPASGLVLQIQPDEGISLHFGAKVPGEEMRITGVDMDFCYADWFRTRPSTGYETLLYDAMTGDQTLFQRADNIEFGWRAVQPFLDAWAKGGIVHGYKAGSEGPAAADALLERDGRAWRPLGK